MKKIINKPENYVDEMLEGLYAAHPDYITIQRMTCVALKHLIRSLERLVSLQVAVQDICHYSWDM